MSKLAELIKELCPDGVPKMKLGDIGKVSMCKRILKSDTAITGDVPFYKIGTFGKEADAFISYAKYDEFRKKYSYPRKGDVLISAAGTIGRTVIYDGSPAYYQDSNIVWLAHDESIVLNKYLYYCYELQPWAVSSGGTISRLYNDNIMKAEIYVPPLPVQCEIVRILDNFTALTSALTSALTAELTAQRKRYSGLLNSLLSYEGRDAQDGVLWKKLGDILIIKNGKDYKSFAEGDVPVYGSGGIMTYINSFAYDKPSVLIPRKGSLDKLYYVEGPFWTVDTIFYTEINIDLVKPKFVFYYLKILHLERLNKAGGVPSLTQSVLNQLSFPIPSLEEQQRIVDILDRFDKLCNDLSEGLPAEIAARQKQYEYYRDKLLTFKEKKA